MANLLWAFILAFYGTLAKADYVLTFEPKISGGPSYLVLAEYDEESLITTFHSPSPEELFQSIRHRGLDPSFAQHPHFQNVSLPLFLKYLMAQKKDLTLENLQAYKNLGAPPDLVHFLETTGPGNLLSAWNDRERRIRMMGPIIEILSYQFDLENKKDLSCPESYSRLTLLDYYENEHMAPGGPVGLVPHLSKEQLAGLKVEINEEGLICDREGQPLSMKGMREYVLDRNGNLYIRRDPLQRSSWPWQISNQSVDPQIVSTFPNFHHSSFLAGGEVAAAGMIRVMNGKISLINNDSGHYLPSEEDFKKILRMLYHKKVELNSRNVALLRSGASPATLDLDIYLDLDLE